MSTSTWTEYRIESRRPGRRRWEYISATSTASRDRETAEKYKVRQEEMSSAGWEFRITSREVTVTATEWSPL